MTPALPVERHAVLLDSDEVLAHGDRARREPAGSLLDHVPRERVGPLRLRRAHVHGERERLARRDVVRKGRPCTVPHDRVRAHVEPVVDEVDGVSAARRPGPEAGVLERDLDVHLSARNDRRRGRRPAVSRVELRGHTERDRVHLRAGRGEPRLSFTDQVRLHGVGARSRGHGDGQGDGLPLAGEHVERQHRPQPVPCEQPARCVVEVVGEPHRVGAGRGPGRAGVVVHHHVDRARLAGRPRQRRAIRIGDGRARLHRARRGGLRGVVTAALTARMWYRSRGGVTGLTDRERSGRGVGLQRRADDQRC